MIVFYGFSTNAHANVFLCFSNENNNKFFQLDLPSDSSNTGEIKYKDSPEIITIKQVSETATSFKNQRIAIVKSKWTAFDDKKNITYILTTQGAVVIELLVMNKKNRTREIFFHYPDAYTQSGCEWPSD
jgi:CRISPR/Cas system CMR-associated protein Cmr1 (group 7 of RAMP superfamily)